MLILKGIEKKVPVATLIAKYNAERNVSDPQQPCTQGSLARTFEQKDAQYDTQGAANEAEESDFTEIVFHKAPESDFTEAVIFNATPKPSVEAEFRRQPPFQGVAKQSWCFRHP